MWVVQMNVNGPMTNGLAELNHDVQTEHKETRDGVLGEGQELSEEDESQINEDVEDVNDGRAEVVQVQDHAQSGRPQQHSQGPLVRWERFLPLRSLKVLLVENDNSTRHVVSALLRNCGYEVTAAANGFQAWKLLYDLTNHIDLILTEVVMPCLSGIGLLHKIMNHKTCKNIPVIMMSSHDSMNIVFKCLSKGAVDFLVKPIRKNELKNLWQHVWRKCHSVSCSNYPALCMKLYRGPILDSKLQSSGSGSGSGSESGSESGVRTQKSTKSKSDEESDNNSGSNNVHDIGSIGLHARDGSDHGSGTQSSWTKRAIEVDSPKPMSPWDQVADPPDSACAQVILSKLEAHGNNWVPVTTANECELQDDDLVLGKGIMGKDLEIGVPRITNSKLGHLSEKVVANLAGNNGEKLPEINLKDNVEQIEKAQIELNSEKPSGDSRNQAVDVMGVMTNSTDPQTGSAVFDFPNSLSKFSNQKDKVVYETKDTPSLELSLKRLRDVRDTGTSAHDRNVLRHSDLSAFSRYNSASTTNKAQTGNVGSCSPLDNSSEAVKTNSIQNFQSNSNSTSPNQRSNGSSNNNDMGSTTNNVFSKPEIFCDKPAPKYTARGPHPSSAFQSVQNGHMLLPQPDKANTAIANTSLTPTRDMKHQVQVEHHHHHCHHHYHHVHNMPQQQQLAKHDDSSVKNMAAAALQCGSSNRLSTLVDGIFGNYSLDGSVSGSDHGSNGLNGSYMALNFRTTNTERDNGVDGNLGTECGIGSRTAVDQNRTAQREAALNKFFQKRKERCFKKKVRYQSRKKLAEQRPRIRGQFVRQATQANKGKDVLS